MTVPFQPGQIVAWKGVPMYRDGEGEYIRPTGARDCGLVRWPTGGVAAIPHANMTLLRDARRQA